MSIARPQLPCTGLGLRALLFGLAVVVPARAQTKAAVAEPAPLPESPATREYRVDFSADRVEVDPKLGTLELDGNVHVSSQRYQLTSEHLALTRGPLGVEAEGSSRVAFCACTSAPITLRTTSATLAPPTDALFSNAVVDVGGVPLLWLPRLWLRVPSRVGMTLPGVSYRGQDGFLVGAGVHVPLALEGGQVSSALYVGAGTYVARGARVESELSTPGSSTKIAWDHVRDTAVEVDAHGSADSRGQTFAFRADAERGARGRVAPSSLDVAARRMDRARLGLVHAGELVLGAGVRSDAPRGGALRDYGALGPELFVGYASGLGSQASVELGGGTLTTVVDGHALSLLSERAQLSGELRPGPLGIGVKLGDSAELRVAEKSRTEHARSGAEARVGVPLVRGFGRLSHWLEPLVLMRALLDAEPRGGGVHADRTLLAAAGVDSSLGDSRLRQAAGLSLRAAWLSDPAGAEPALASRLSADARWLGAAESLAYLSSERSFASFSRLRVGQSESLHVGLRADGATSGSGARARPLFDEAWLEPARAMLDRSGWTGGALLGVPLGNALSAGAGLDYDLSARTLLASSGLARYRHACGCLAVAAFVGHRLGRGGIDAWLGLDLMP